MTMNTRQYASKLDKPVDGPINQGGHHASSEAIGGFYGMSWDEYFEDHLTGETYKVKCWDGVYSSKDAYPPEDYDDLPAVLPIEEEVRFMSKERAEDICDPKDCVVLEANSLAAGRWFTLLSIGKFKDQGPTIGNVTYKLTAEYGDTLYRMKEACDKANILNKGRNLH